MGRASSSDQWDVIVGAATDVSTHEGRTVTTWGLRMRVDVACRSHVDTETQVLGSLHIGAHPPGVQGLEPRDHECSNPWKPCLDLDHGGLPRLMRLPLSSAHTLVLG